MSRSKTRLATLTGLLCLGLAATPLYGEKGASPETPEAQSQVAPMTNERLAELVRRIDEDAKGQPGFWRLRVEGHPVTVITDAHADRMRIVTPVTRSEALDGERLKRLMQANFDTALDARYAIAKGVLWGSFIHPLSPLTDRQFLSGLGQAVNLAETYGSTYSSGALIFGGGDSGELQRRELIDKLLNKGLAI